VPASVHEAVRARIPTTIPRRQQVVRVTCASCRGPEQTLF
jgi:hypothetical protein